LSREVYFKPFHITSTSAKFHKPDVLQDFERDDIFTRKDTISGLKSPPLEGLGKLVNIPWTVQFLEYDITTCNIALPIPYK